MVLSRKALVVRKSSLPGAGKGLFTRVPIRKGRRIAEYKGRVMTWKEAEKLPDWRDGCIFYFNLKHVIDGWRAKGAVAQFANDAEGITRIKGLRNNAVYDTEGKRCFIVASKDIPAGSEIFVEYGKEYWDVVRENIRKERRKSQRRKVKSLSFPDMKDRQAA